MKNTKSRKGILVYQWRISYRNHNNIENHPIEIEGSFTQDKLKVILEGIEDYEWWGKHNPRVTVLNIIWFD